MNEPTYTLSDDAVASNPGKAKISRIRWLLRYPTWPVAWAGAFAVSLPFILLHWSVGIASIVLGALNFLYWKRVEEHFAHGDANPGLIVSMHPMRIAVRTDLTKGLGSYPVIKIMEEKPWSRWGQTAEKDLRLATVSLYSEHLEDEDQHLPFWEDFFPKPIEPIGRRKEDVDAVMATFSEEAWAQLQQGLESLGHCRPGLHRLHTDTSDWGRPGATE